MHMERFLVIFAVVTVGFLLITVIYHEIRKVYARKRVAKRSTEEKLKDLNKDLERFGFFYDAAQDIICSARYPWQREMGYCRLYDEAALTMNMAIQCEPIYFQYDNRRWLLEFWKGQYGLATGGEIGIYVTDKEDISVPGMFEGPFFHAVSEEEEIPMEFILYRNKTAVVSRMGTHWWLTAFDVGVFSKPKQLALDIRLTFPGRMMTEAFVKGLKEAGYREETYRICRNTVQLHFSVPHSEQPYRKARPLFFLVQCMNHLYCILFQRLTGDFVKTLDKIDYLRFRFPVLYRSVIVLGGPLKRKKVFHRLRGKEEGVREAEQ